MRHGRNFESGTGRFDEKYIALPSGDRRGVASRYCPENGTTSGLDHFPSRKRVTEISPRWGKFVY